MPELKNIAGVAELSLALKSFPDKLATKVLRQAIARGAATIRDEARARAPVRTGVLRNAIIMKYISEKSNKYVITYFVLARKGPHKQVREVRRRSAGFVGPGPQASGKVDAFYWRFVEFGTAHMAARPFMRPAFDSKRDEALKIIIEKLQVGVEKTARELVLGKGK